MVRGGVVDAVFGLVAWDGIEPPTRGFSGLTRPFFQSDTRRAKTLWTRTQYVARFAPDAWSRITPDGLGQVVGQVIRALCERKDT
jgi:hypothetical protein